MKFLVLFILIVVASVIIQVTKAKCGKNVSEIVKGLAYVSIAICIYISRF